VLGTAPSAANAAERLSYKLAIQQLSRSLRSELGSYGVPVSLVAPLGSDEPALDSVGVSATLGVRAQSPLTTWCAPCHGLVGGAGRVPPEIGEYARHSVTEMLDGVPYVLAPGSPNDTLSVGCVATLGYNRLWPALAILRAFLLPLHSLMDSGAPTAWREALTRWWLRAHGNAAGAGAGGFVPLQELEA